MSTEKKTTSYKIIPDSKGNKYAFICEMSRSIAFVTRPVKADSPKEELNSAWEEARMHFNRCRKCGKWVIDAMFNPDVLNCVGCTPIEVYPDYCPECGAKTNDTAYFCHICGTRLLYGGEWAHEKTNSD